MQLFTIGQYKLNADGTPMMASSGKPALTYVAGRHRRPLAGVHRLQLVRGPEPTDRTNARFFGSNADLERDWRPMQDYNRVHAEHRASTRSAPRTSSATTMPAQTTPDTDGRR